jgi:peptide/nickel transport system substrate-binding protein
MTTTTDLSRLTRRGLLALAGAGLATMMLPEGAFAQGRKILVIAAGQDIPNFDPHIATGYSASFFFRNVYDPLVRVAGNPPEAVPALAQSWESSADGLSWTFKLNPAAKFHNGDAVTADDVVYSALNARCGWPRATAG